MLSFLHCNLTQHITILESSAMEFIAAFFNAMSANSSLKTALENAFYANLRLSLVRPDTVHDRLSLPRPERASDCAMFTHWRRRKSGESGNLCLPVGVT